MTQVKSIDQDSQGVTIHTSEGKIIKSKYAVVAASPRGASRIQISSEGTTNFLPLTTPVGFSGFNILFAYEQQFWHGEPFDIGTASEKADSLLGPSQIMDLTPFDKTKPGLIRLITSPERVEAASEEEIVKVEYFVDHSITRSEITSTYHQISPTLGQPNQELH